MTDSPADDDDQNDDDGLDLNDLARFTRSGAGGRLVLEEYDHCEVPAGCGGVVLRWLDPQRCVPLRIHLFSTALRVGMWIDGAEQHGARATLGPGPHVLALELTFAPGAPSGILALAMICRDAFARRSGDQLRVDILTADDDTWLATFDDVASDTWRTLEGDADIAGWQPLPFASVYAPPGRNELGSWAYGRAAEHGALPLMLALPRLSAEPTLVRVRKRFEVPTP